MSVLTESRPEGSAVDAQTFDAPAEPAIVALKRRTIDTVLIWLGVVATAVLIVAGALLTWGSNFAEDYVGDELAAQNITFPAAESLEGQGRGDLVGYAGGLVDTGEEAEAYASYIEGHIAGIADGATYADLGGPQRAAEAALNDAIAAEAPAAEIAELQAEVDTINGQRDSVFRGEMLRGTLLNTFAWSTVGNIAGIAAVIAFIAAGVMLLLVVAGVFHHRRTPA